MGIEIAAQAVGSAYEKEKAGLSRPLFSSISN
jgi:hypothetical protein